MLEAFQPLLSFEYRAALRQPIYLQLLEAVASHRVADLPDRYAPRRRKKGVQEKVDGWRNLAGT